jgi:hypothetical protein
MVKGKSDVATIVKGKKIRGAVTQGKMENTKLICRRSEWRDVSWGHVEIITLLSFCIIASNKHLNLKYEPSLWVLFIDKTEGWNFEPIAWTNFTEKYLSWEATSCLATKKFSEFYWTRTFTTMFTTVPPFVPSMSHMNPVNNLPFFTIRHTLILFPYLRLGFPNALLSGFATRVLYAYILCTTHEICPDKLILVIHRVINLCP